MDSQSKPAAGRSANEVVREAAACKKREDWEALGKLADEIPEVPTPSWLDALDSIAFGLGKLGHWEQARRVAEAAFALEPTAWRASAIAYFHYDALFAHKGRQVRLDEPEVWRRGFEGWTGEALRLNPESIVDWYRLGQYYASILSAKDVKALECFRGVFRLWRRISEGEQNSSNRNFKNYIRSLYGAARSAYRLKRYDEARGWIFDCIRQDRERNHMDSVFKYFAAGRVLAAQGSLVDAERALRLALEGKYNGDRDFVYGLLAEVALRQGRIGDAVDWIAGNVRPHRRKSYLWRLLGEAEEKRGNTREALAHYRSSLLKDRMGRHKTLLKMGQIHEGRGDFVQARRSYDEASSFRAKKFQREDGDALQALARLCERMNDLEGARRALRRMSQLPFLTVHAEKELLRISA